MVNTVKSWTQFWGQKYVLFGRKYFCWRKNTCSAEVYKPVDEQVPFPFHHLNFEEQIVVEKYISAEERNTFCWGKKSWDQLVEGGGWGATGFPFLFHDRRRRVHTRSTRGPTNTHFPHLTSSINTNTEYWYKYHGRTRGMLPSLTAECKGSTTKKEHSVEFFYITVFSIHF